MLAAKTNRSSSSDTHNGKNTQTTPRSSKLFRGGSTKSSSGSPSLFRSSSSFLDRFSKSIDDAKPTTERRPSKIISSADKLPHPTKKPDLQPKLIFVQEELRRTREQMASVEQEKIKAGEELNFAKRTAEEKYNKLNEALAARNKAEEGSKIASIKADEMEKIGIGAMRKKEEEFQKKIDHIRNLHNLDVLALDSAKMELERVRKELTVASDARDRAISHSNDAMKTAEINAEKFGIFSSEINQLNAFLDSGMDSLSNENQEIVEKLNLEIDCLKSKLEKTKFTDVKLVEMEVLLEAINTELNVAKTGKLDAIKFVDALKQQVELLLVQLQEAKLSQKSSTHLSDLVSKQLEDCKLALRNSESELAALREKVISLNLEAVNHKEDLKKSERQLNEANIEASEMAKTVVALKLELQNLKQEKLDVMENDKIVASEIQSLTEEKEKLMKELEAARNESENSKKAMEELASALKEVSLEARETREILLEKHADLENFYFQTEHLRSALKNTEESYQVMLDEARYEIICLKKSIERAQTEAESLEAELKVKELCPSSIKFEKEESESESFKGEDCQVEAIKKLSFLLVKPEATKPMDSALSNCLYEYEFLDSNAIHGEKTNATLGAQNYLERANNENVNGVHSGKDETLTMGSKLDFPAHECNVKSIDDEVDCRTASRSFRKVNVLPSKDFTGDSLKLIRFEEVKVKKALLNKLGNFLKKKRNCK
ncbi:WEB family protein At5g16730, chloroplastic-like isoform X2 [Phalaenopsis equestris]|uniref:WEB family protein At5g16730, chloroplastic-like isoform X2 n=1 Tax=Phalaenopsis equestris TaxID=78828 RepID=UPI0009E4AE78|nr:WEB family protein At5g16730, chloroplastic-like isoform X2 [Phalaenopsis equestris]